MQYTFYKADSGAYRKAQNFFSYRYLLYNMIDTIFPRKFAINEYSQVLNSIFTFN